MGEPTLAGRRPPGAPSSSACMILMDESILDEAKVSKNATSKYACLGNASDSAKGMHTTDDAETSAPACLQPKMCSPRQLKQDEDNPIRKAMALLDNQIPSIDNSSDPFEASVPIFLRNNRGSEGGEVSSAADWALTDSKTDTHTLEEARQASADTSASPGEFYFGRSSSSLFPEGVSAVGVGTLVQDSLPFGEDELYALAAASQKTSNMAAGDLGELTSSESKASIASSPLLSDPKNARTPLNEQKNGEYSADACTNSTLNAAMGWPFESSLRKPWENVDQEERKRAEGACNIQLEDSKKKRIWVIHRGVCMPVSWYLDTSADDVKTAILCACDVLADEEVEEEQPNNASGFCLRLVRPLPESADVDCDELFMGVKTLTLRCGLPSPEEADNTNQDEEESKSRPHASAENGERTSSSEVSVNVVLGPRVFSKDFPSLTDGSTYLLEPRSSEGEDDQQSKDLENLRKLTGDKWRRVSIAVDPLRHIEAQKAIVQMRRGTNLLKHTRYGHPHLRQFQLSADRQRLVWYSASKGKDESLVHMGDLEGLVLGQKSLPFMGYRIPSLQHLSFSLIFKKDGQTTTSYKTTVILPDAALEDSRSLDLTCKDEFEFDTWITGCKAIIAANKGLLLSKIQLLSHSRRFLKAMQRCEAIVQFTKLPEIKERAALHDCMDLPWHRPEELERKYEEQEKRLQAAAEEGPAYSKVLGDSAEVDDEEMEFQRMRELLHEIRQVLNKAKAELKEYKEAERLRQRTSTGNTATTTESTDSNPPHSINELCVQASEEPPTYPEVQDTSPPMDNSAIVAISSGGQVLMKTGAPGLTFEEKFKRAAGKTVDLDAVQEQIQEGISNLLQQAASQTAEAQQLLSSALAAAASVVGVESDKQTEPAELPPEDIEKLRSINQLLWRAEVDVENVEDMLARLQAPSGFGGLALAGTVANLNQMVTEQVNKWGGQLASMVTDFLRRAEIPQLTQAGDPQRNHSVSYSDSEYEDEFY